MICEVADARGFVGAPPDLGTKNEEIDDCLLVRGCFNFVVVVALVLLGRFEGLAGGRDSVVRSSITLSLKSIFVCTGKH